MSEFTHLDETGQLRMVDVGDKAETRRQATAACRVIVGPKVFPLLQAGRLPKGDVWAAAAARRHHGCQEYGSADSVVPYLAPHRSGG